MDSFDSNGGMENLVEMVDFFLYTFLKTPVVLLELWRFFLYPNFRENHWNLAVNIGLLSENLRENYEAPVY